MDNKYLQSPEMRQRLEALQARFDAERPLDRQTLFSNEAFAIGMMQAVSGGAILATLSQVEPLTRFGGPAAVGGFLSLAAVSLLLAVLAAWFKHQYKMWDVKSSARIAGAVRAWLKIAKTEGVINPASLMLAAQEEYPGHDEGERFSRKSLRYLAAMRWCMGASVIVLVLSILMFVAIAWWRAVSAAI